MFKSETDESAGRRPIRGLHVGSDEGGEHPVLLLQQSFRFVVLQDVSSLHHDDQIGRQDGVDPVLHKHKN